MEALLSKAKGVLDVTGNYKDEEISDLVEAGLYDLGIAGINTDLLTDPLIVRAVLTYCLANYRGVENPELYKRSYDEQKAQLQMATRYTNWNGDC